MSPADTSSFSIPIVLPKVGSLGHIAASEAQRMISLMTAQDRGSARLARLLADPQRAARVAAIREQMNQPSPDWSGPDDDENDLPPARIMTVDDLHRAAAAATDVDDPDIMGAAWRRD
ncbi:hypothetical protein KUF57_25525 [Mycolicibacterium sp. PAM1]|uniref:Uncharacterized protein n=2 Tax=Mycolicibacterium gilvum TaxID=1804 RepID=E6TQ85_MYCSR|nr:hypothetical protein Mspyr1_55760 [Mycolicibacterium gilvum Spyr1]MBV5246893.1 hypothetical protein [Mycolicibacterium sp. PAM1]